MKKTTSCFVAALLSSAAFANTATYYVAMDGDDSAAGTADAPLLSVLTAVTRANESIDGGDDSATIHVAPGTYDLTSEESYIMLTKAVAIVGNPDNPAQVVILNNSTSHRAVYLEHASSALKGLTIKRTSGTWDPSDGSGGGLVNMENGIIEDCVIQGGSLGSSNSTINQQGGNVYMAGGIIRRCKILDGYARIKNASSYRENVAVGNIIVRGVTGVIPVVENSLISGGYGYGFVSSDVTCRKKAGNLYLYGSCRIVNCTIINGSGNGVGGVAICYNSDYADCKVVNCVMYNNGGSATYLHKDWGSNNANINGFFVNCAIGNATKPNDTCIGVDAAAFENFSGGDYRPLKDASSLIDAGTSRGDYKSVYGATSDTDLAGGSRFGGRNLDIGCYERVKYGFIITVQ